MYFTRYDFSFRFYFQFRNTACFEIFETSSFDWFAFTADSFFKSFQQNCLSMLYHMQACSNSKWTFWINFLLLIDLLNWLNSGFFAQIQNTKNSIFFMFFRNPIETKISCHLFKNSHQLSHCIYSCWLCRFCQLLSFIYLEFFYFNLII